jgi:hypothetical protein
MRLVIILLLLLVLALPLAWYLLSPLFIVVEADDPSPLVVADNLDTMDAGTRADFDRQVLEMNELAVAMSDPVPARVQLVRQGAFVARAHEVSGLAQVIEVPTGRLLRFEDFETVNGPELRIYLSSGLGDDDIVDLGKIKATKGNVNYEIPLGTDLEKYDKVLIWCRPFGVLFSYAQMS